MRRLMLVLLLVLPVLPGCLRVPARQAPAGDLLDAVAVSETSEPDATEPDTLTDASDQSPDCIPSCDDKTCGWDGCGRLCVCPEGFWCAGTVCKCGATCPPPPACWRPCGGPCSCFEGQSCGPEGLCVPK